MSFDPDTAFIGVLKPYSNYWHANAWGDLTGNDTVLNDFHSTPDRPENTTVWGVKYESQQGNYNGFLLASLPIAGSSNFSATAASYTISGTSDFASTTTVDAANYAKAREQWVNDPSVLWTLCYTNQFCLFKCPTATSFNNWFIKFALAANPLSELSPVNLVSLPYDCNIQSMINVNAPNRVIQTALSGRTTANHNNNITHSYSLNFTFSYDKYLLQDLIEIFEAAARTGAPLVYVPAQEADAGSSLTHLTYTDRPIYVIMPSQIPQIQQTHANIYTFTIDGVDAL